MVDIKKTIQEAQHILTFLKDKVDGGTGWIGSEKADIERRINHLLDITQPEHAGNKLDIGFLDLRDNIDNQIQNKDNRVSQLSTELNQQKQTVADQAKQITKLTDLTVKLEKISQDLGKADNTAELDNLKTNIQTFKDSNKAVEDKANEVKTNTESIKAQTEELKTENKGLHQDLIKTKTITYITGATGGMSFLGLIYLIFKDTIKAWLNKKLDKGAKEIQKVIEKAKDKIDKIN